MSESVPKHKNKQGSCHRCGISKCLLRGKNERAPLRHVFFLFFCFSFGRCCALLLEAGSFLLMFGSFSFSIMTKSCAPKLNFTLSKKKNGSNCKLLFAPF